MTFDDWFDEVENFGTRSIRFYDDVNSPDPKYNDMLLSWLKAAYQVGYEHALSRIIDDGK
jgi:hypothetical protein